MKKIMLSLMISGAFVGHAQVHKTDAHLETYAKIAYMSYSDALADAGKLNTAIQAFTAKPTEKTMAAAKKAWLVSRESYLPSEIFRLSGGPIDTGDGWVGKAYDAGREIDGGREIDINSWPLDENMNDYTIDADGNRTSGNIVDTIGWFTPGGENPTSVDISHITARALLDLNYNGRDENVTTGYHAIEFLLWGQDQDYGSFIRDKVTHGAMVAGQRPLSDYTTDKFAPRRKALLNVLAAQLVDDLAVIRSAWAPKSSKGTVKGLYRQAFLGQGEHAIATKTALRQITSGMGTFIKSELANERIAVAVLTPSEEDEHSCFSDNTHRDIVRNFQGFKNALYGEYNGKKVGSALIDKVPTAEKAEIDKLVADINRRVARIDHVAKTKMHFDYQIQPSSGEVKNIVAAKNAMRHLGDKMIVVVKAYGIKIGQDDVTDSEENLSY